MTSTCRSDNGPGKPRPYRYNPFEIALVGTDLDRLSALAHRVAESMPQGMRPCVVLEQSGAGSLREGFPLAEIDGSHIVESRTDHADGHLPPAAALDADWALVVSSTPQPMPTVAWIETERPKGLGDVRAYTGPRTACPILSAHDRFFTNDDVDGLCQFLAETLRRTAQDVPLYGLVLAGGQSTRMGSDKAALDYHGRPQVHHVYDLLTAHCPKVYVSLRPAQASDPMFATLPQISDRYVGFGPMGGILSAFKTAPDAAWLVVACDLPHLDHATLAHLLAHRNPFKAATAFLSAHDGLPEPLCAAYEPKSHLRLLRFLGRGYHCPRKMLINSDSHVLAPVDPDALNNVNVPDEFEAARSKLHHPTNAVINHE